VENIVNAAQADIVELNEQLAQFSKLRITRDTSMEEIFQRFPTLARETEKEIKNHEYVNTV
jgi:hypothetical protein